MSIKTSTSESLVLQADNILLDYLQNDGSRKQILTDFSMQVRAGEILAVLGPSGVGKSSLLRVLAGLKQPSCGQIRVHNKLVTSPHPRLAFMFQDPCLLPWLNLEANVAFGLDFRSQPKLDARARPRVQRCIAEVSQRGITSISRERGCAWRNGRLARSLLAARNSTLDTLQCTG